MVPIFSKIAIGGMREGPVVFVVKLIIGRRP
jgi:hypothetical protein